MQRSKARLCIAFPICTHDLVFLEPKVTDICLRTDTRNVVAVSITVSYTYIVLVWANLLCVIGTWYLLALGNCCFSGTVYNNTRTGHGRQKTHTLHTTPCVILSDTQMVPSMSNVTMSIVAAPILTAEIPVGVGRIHG